MGWKGGRVCEVVGKGDGWSKKKANKAGKINQPATNSPTPPLRLPPPLTRPRTSTFHSHTPSLPNNAPRPNPIAHHPGLLPSHKTHKTHHLNNLPHHHSQLPQPTIPTTHPRHRICITHTQPRDNHSVPPALPIHPEPIPTPFRPRFDPQPTILPHQHRIQQGSNYLVSQLRNPRSFRPSNPSK